MHGKRSSEARHSPSNRLTGAQAESPAAGRPLSGLAGRAGRRGTVGPAAGRRARDGRGGAGVLPASGPVGESARCPVPNQRMANNRFRACCCPCPGARRRVARDACKSFDGHDPDGTGEVTTDQRGLAGLACESSRAVS